MNSDSAEFHKRDIYNNIISLLNRTFNITWALGSSTAVKTRALGECRPQPRWI